MSSVTKANNDVNLDVAQGLLREAERTFGIGDVDTILQGYTDDIIIRYANIPEMRGKEEARKFLEARFKRQLKYNARKTLRFLDDNKICILWTGDWTDGSSGAAMEGRGIEIWTLRETKLAVWEAVFNVWEKENNEPIPII